VSIIGRSVTPAIHPNDSSEHLAWVGKPWRRVELLTHRDFYGGREVDRDTACTVHVGLRRLGLHATLTVGRQTVLDYSDEQA
jgi:hypothetical protein